MKNNTIMKIALLFLFLIYNTLIVFGQNYESYGKTNFYQLTRPTLIVQSDDSTNVILAKNQLIFTDISTEENGDHIIQFWNLDLKKIINHQNNQFLNKYIYKDLNASMNTLNLDDYSNYKLFRIKSKDFKSNVIPYYNAGFQSGALDWSSGVVILPLKSRFNPTYTFSKDLSLGLSGGFKTRISHRNPTYLNFLVNFGISSVTVDASSSNLNLTKPSEHASFTSAIGVIFENHSYQFGIFWGKDRLMKNDAESTGWIYNNKGWLSIGIGYQLFKSDKSNQNAKAGTN